MMYPAASLLLHSVVMVTVFVQDAASADDVFSYFYGEALQAADGPGPLKWATAFPASCSGTHQSPIDIVTFNSVKPPNAIMALLTGHQRAAPDFIFSPAYNSAPSVMTLTNSGHTVELTTSDAESISFIGGGLPNTYRLAGVHFHWGGGPYRGSEHTINGNRFPIEMHIVHMKTSYATVAAAVASQDPSALAVLGVLFEEAAIDNPAMNPITDALVNVKEVDKTYNLGANERFALRQLLPAITTKFYRYSGSLTSPRCAEVVAWTVFKQRLSISTAQLGKFRDVLVKGNLPMVDNFRPTQPLNGRIVQRFGHSIFGRSMNNELDEDED